MRVIVVKPYKTYGIGVEIDIKESLFDKHPGVFKPIVRVTANTDIHTQSTDEEE